MPDESGDSDGGFLVSPVLSEFSMPRTLYAPVLIWAAAAIVQILLQRTAVGQTVWSGLTFEFEKLNDAPVTQPESQDRISDSVWITRSVQQGIFNIRTETGYQGTSPEGTRWATGINNPGKAIAATNWADLTFASWINAYGGPGGSTLPSRLLSTDAVVHLVSENIYLDLQFTDWTASAGGGGFSYLRAEGEVTPPSPTGDYNGNGVVDAADYVVWRDTLSQTVSPGSGADGDRSGTIDAPDYDHWRARFGNMIAGGTGASALAAVPEPVSVMVLIGWVAVAWCFGKRAVAQRFASVKVR
jgi:hypothetical protein